MPGCRLLILYLLCAAHAVAASSADTISTYRNCLGETCLRLDAEEVGGGKQHGKLWRNRMTWTGMSVFLTSVAIKNNTEPLTTYRYKKESQQLTNIDEYARFSPYALIAGLKVAGYEGRSATPRLLAAAVASNVIMAASTKVVKEWAQSARPDMTDCDSYVSGHAAVAFTAASILHNEYGMTRSPWFSAGGYGVAAATAMLRVLNGRHRAVDVLGGAGAGIFATELGYCITDRIFGARHLQRLDDTFYNPDIHHSFIDIQMGAGLHARHLAFTPQSTDGQSLPADSVSIGVSAATSVEGAYYINKYIGFGGMIRLAATPMKPLNLSHDERAQVAGINATLAKYTYRDASQGKDVSLPGVYAMYVEQGQQTDVSVDCGAYATLPITGRLSIGAKALAGIRLSGSTTYTSRNGELCYQGSDTSHDGSEDHYYLFTDEHGETVSLSPQHNSLPFNEINPVLKNATEEFDMLHIDASNALNAVVGINLAWRQKDCFTWKLFADLDTSRIKYKYTRRLFAASAIEKAAMTTLPADEPEVWRMMNHTERRTLSKRMNHVTVGFAFSVNL